MTPEILKRRLADWPAASAEALGPALDAAAETIAAEVRRRLGASQDDTGVDPVTLDRTADGQATVTVSKPDAVALEFGTRGTEARPLLRPAIAATRDGIGRSIVEALRHALTRSAR